MNTERVEHFREKLLAMETELDSELEGDKIQRC